jgi:hypothetical protein
MRTSAPLASILLIACGTPADGPIELLCQPDQAFPYADGAPYLGIHGDAANSDEIACTTGSAYQQIWHALEGLGMPQPNTFSPDGLTLYATTTHPDADGCRLHALDGKTGEVQWCRNYAPSISYGSAEVDENGNLFFTVADQVVSVDADGNERWSTSVASEGVEQELSWGLHFHPNGSVVTATQSGVVFLLDRSDGNVQSTLSIPDVYGFVAPATLDLDLDLSLLLPDSVNTDIETVWGVPEEGEADASFGTFLGAAGFVDNTIGISAAGDIYVIGGGQDEDHGALVKITVEGTNDALELVPSWFAETNKGSATSPSITKDGRFVTVSDGSSSDTFFNPDAVDARVKVYDIEACDANTDSDEDSARCGVLYEEAVERWPLIGAPATLEDGTVLFWELGLDFAADESARDVVAMNETGILWETALPNDMDWTSVLTVTNNHVIGTGTAVTLSEASLLNLHLPKTTENALVILDRHTGEVVFTAEIPDDAAGTVTVGPTGELYVGMLGIFSILSTEKRPTLGLIRFSPTAP